MSNRNEENIFINLFAPFSYISRTMLHAHIIQIYKIISFYSLSSSFLMFL